MENRTYNIKLLFKEKEFWLIILLGILFFHRPIFLEETFFLRDISLYMIPQKQILVEFINNRQVPLWEIYHHGGQPYLGSISNNTLYPGNLIYAVLPLYKAINIDIIFHVIFGALSSYLFARVIGLQPLSGMITGIVYGFCGYTLSRTNLPANFLTIPYLPLLLLFWHLYFLKGTRIFFVLSVSAGVLQLLAGFPEINILSLMFILGWSLVYPYTLFSIRQRCVKWIFLIIFIIGISAVQVFPTIEVISQSERGQGFNYQLAAWWSLTPKRLPEMIFPNFFGRLDTLYHDTYYWGQSIFPEEYPYILSIYFGVAVMTLLIAGVTYKDSNVIVQHRIKPYFILVIIISLTLSLGRYFYLFSYIYKYFPPMHLFRFPIKFFAMCTFPISFLAGYAVEKYFCSADHKNITHRLLYVLWLILIIFFLFTVSFLFSNSFADDILQIYFRQTGNEIFRNGLRSSFIHGFAIYLSLTLIFYYRFRKNRNIQKWLAAIIIVIDLFIAGRQLTPVIENDLLSFKPPVAETIYDEIGKEGRLFRDIKTLNVAFTIPEGFGLDNSQFWKFRWNMDTLVDYWGVYFGIPVIFHSDYDRLGSSRIVTLKKYIDRISWEQKVPILSAGGVNLILTPDQLSIISGIEFVQQYEIIKNSPPLYLYRNNNALRQVEFFDNWEFVYSDQEALEAMTDLNYNPKESVILQYPKPFLFESLLSIPDSIDLKGNSCGESSELRTLSSGLLSKKFFIINKCHGYLIFSESYYPGWKITDNNKQAPIFRANFAFSAIQLLPGEHIIEMNYRPNSILFGAICSILFCFLLWVYSIRINTSKYNTKN